MKQNDGAEAMCAMDKWDRMWPADVALFSRWVLVLIWNNDKMLNIAVPLSEQFSASKT